MRKLIISLAAVALLLAGCQKPELEYHVETKADFSAEVEIFDGQTKTALNSKCQVVWSKGDLLSIFQGSSLADQYELKDACAGLYNGSFRWVSQDNPINSDFNAGVEQPSNVAFYPYAEGLFLEGNMQDGGSKSYTIATVILPQVQDYTANSFANGSFPMVAVTQSMQDHNLKFKNLLGAVKLSLKGNLKVKSIKVEGLNGEKLSGAATVTAYANNLNPVIKMSDEASTMVTLDCGDGVQLNESEVTDFYIALPPVLFTKGFNVIVTDAADHEYTMTAGQNNVILRSSILVMPEVVISESGEGSPEEDEEELVIPVLSVTLNSTSLKLYEDDSVQLKATVRPVDATNKTVVWTSSDATIATVDQTGLVTAVSVGTVEIYAVAGEFVATCVVEVKEKLIAKDYIDEYNVNHGKGVAIGMAVWAPVNCGYHAEDYKWGKLYQWGRKYGQGYDGDATTPELSEGGVSLQGGQSSNNENVFFMGRHDWLYQGDDQLWNSGTGVSPVKTEYDPCPEGWRVPTSAELRELSQNHSGWTKDDNGQRGRWFSGPYSYTASVPQVFFPAAGYRLYYDSNDYGDTRGGSGKYWSASTNNYAAISLDFYIGDTRMEYDIGRAFGYSVRCVQD